MTKLKEMEAKEREEDELQRDKEAEEARENTKRGRKGKRKDKPKAREYSPVALTPNPASPSDSIPVESRIASSPPVLPAIAPALRRPPPVNDDSESEESERAGPSRLQERAPNGWVSSDDEDGPTRRPGTGPRFSKGSRKLAPGPRDEDSEEDLPLSATLDRVAQRATQLQLSAPDSDEEQPLSVLLQKTKLSVPSINFDRHSRSNGPHDDEDDDDRPLGLRASSVARSFNSVQGQGDDDDMPLAYHPEQQRRSQYHMMAQAQQQQMMMQAQLTNSMFFPPQAMMGFGPPMVMQAPPMAAMQDDPKFGVVDKWRRDIIVED